MDTSFSAQEPSRRRFLQMSLAGTAVGLVAGGLELAAPLQLRAQSILTPDAALAELMDGNKRFTSLKMTSNEHDLAILKQHNEEKQEPFAAVLSCADSRVPGRTGLRPDHWSHFRDPSCRKCCDAGNYWQPRIWSRRTGDQSDSRDGSFGLRSGEGRHPGQRSAGTDQLALSPHSARGGSGWNGPGCG